MVNPSSGVLFLPSFLCVRDLVPILTISIA